MIIKLCMEFTEFIRFFNSLSLENKRHKIDAEKSKDITTQVHIPNLAVASLQRLNTERKLFDMKLTNSEAVWFGILELMELVRILREFKITSPDELRAALKK